MHCDTDADLLMNKLAASVLHFRITDTAIEFRARPIDVIKAEYVTNEILACCGTASLYDFVTHLGIDENDISIPIHNDYEPLVAGWCQDCMYSSESPWLDFYHTLSEDSQGMVIVICFGFPPCDVMESCKGVGIDCCTERGFV